ncbi:MAG: hypothetical protein OHK0039_22190 [Bacteroidia bacterium]
MVVIARNGLDGLAKQVCGLHRHDQDTFEFVGAGREIDAHLHAGGQQQTRITDMAEYEGISLVQPQPEHPVFVGEGAHLGTACAHLHIAQGLARLCIADHTAYQCLCRQQIPGSRKQEQKKQLFHGMG